MPALVLRPGVSLVAGVEFERLALRDPLQFDVRAHRVDAHVVGVVEVVANVELAEPQRDREAGEVCGLLGGAVEGDVEVGPFLRKRDCISWGAFCRFGWSFHNVREIVQVDLLQTDSEGCKRRLCSNLRRHCECAIPGGWEG